MEDRSFGCDAEKHVSSLMSEERYSLAFVPRLRVLLTPENILLTVIDIGT
jgi:hypothetical protein